MDERLEKALEFSNFLETQNNQKRIFLKQYKEIVVTDDFLADMSNQVVKNILSCRAVMVL